MRKKTHNSPVNIGATFPRMIHFSRRLYTYDPQWFALFCNCNKERWDMYYNKMKAIRR